MNPKTILKTYPPLKLLASRLCYTLCGNKVKVKGKGNVISYSGAFLRKCRIVVIGNGNTIEIDGSELTRLENCHFIVHGNNNRIVIGKSTSTSVNISIEDDDNQVLLGDRFRGGGNSELAAIEGTTISFGRDCLLSANICLRTGDSHSILDGTTGKRTNRSRSIVIGEHVWIGNTVLIFKGVQIGAHSIVGGGSVVSGKKFPDNVLIAGNPATIIRNNIDWTDERIQVQI